MGSNTKISSLNYKLIKIISYLYPCLVAKSRTDVLYKHVYVGTSVGDVSSSVSVKNPDRRQDISQLCLWRHNLFSLCWILPRWRARRNKYNEEQPVYSTTELPPAPISRRCLNKFSGATFLGVTEHYKIHISIHEFGELRVSGPPNLYIFEPWGETGASGETHTGEESVHPAHGGGRATESFLRICFCQMKKGAGNFWHYVLSGPRMRSEAVYHLFFFLSFSFSDGKTSQSYRAPCYSVSSFHNKPICFQTCVTRGLRPFLSKFKTLCVRSVLDI